MKQLSNGFDMSKFMNKNQAYFDHLAGKNNKKGKCVCYQCDCGRCKCVFQKAKIQSNLPGASLYKDSFNNIDSQVSNHIYCQSKWHSHSENP